MAWALVIDMKYRLVSSLPIRTSEIYLKSCSQSSSQVSSSGSVDKSLLSPAPAQNSRKVPVWVCWTFFLFLFFSCVLDHCSGSEAVNQPKMPDQFDLLTWLSSFCLHSKLFTEFILKVPLGRLVKQKLDCLIDIVHSDLFTHHGEGRHTHTQRCTHFPILQCMQLHSRCSNIGNHTESHTPAASPRQPSVSPRFRSLVRRGGNPSCHLRHLSIPIAEIACSHLYPNISIPIYQFFKSQPFISSLFNYLILFSPWSLSIRPFPLSRPPPCSTSIVHAIVYFGHDVKYGGQE